MSTIIEPALMTSAEFEALPEVEGVERWLIRGQLREEMMTVRNRWHSQIMAQIVYLLKMWKETHAEARGIVVVGEAGFRLSNDPSTIVGVDVAYVDAEVVKKNSPDTTLFDGAPVLAVEILSPSDRAEIVDEKIEEYLRNGTKIVWVVNPHFSTITVYRSDTDPEMFNRRATITAEPYLPGFAAAVSKIFEL